MHQSLVTADPCPLLGRRSDRGLNSLAVLYASQGHISVWLILTVKGNYSYCFGCMNLSDSYGIFSSPEPKAHKESL